VISEFWWIVTRASGLIAWALLTLSLIWGMLLATRVLKPRDKPAWLLDLHRWLGALTAGFVALHIAALLADTYVTFSWSDMLIPFASSYKTVGVGLGVIAVYLLVAVQVSSMLMRRIPTRWWRRIHLSSYLLVLITSWHAVLSGTDIGRGVYAVAAIALTVSPIFVFAIRAAKPPVRRKRRAATPTHRPQPAETTSSAI
jgi:DMSO/TMAO reductase YedYZ heme-binding membrane subunit